MKPILILTSTLCLVSCDTSNPNSTEWEKIGFIEKVRALDYDGHKWIVYRWDRGGSMTHHPDCPCLKKQQSN